MKRCLVILFVWVTVSVQAQQTDSIVSGVYYWNKLLAKEDETGIKRQILEGKTFALAHFEVYALTLEPGMSYPRHKYADQDELMIMKEGELKVITNDEVKVLGPGSIGFVMAGDQEEIQNLGTTAATYFILKYRSKLPIDIARATRDGGSFMLNWNDLSTTNTGKGYRRNFFDRGTSQLRQFEMHTTALNADSVSHAPHMHIQEEIILILKGNVEMQIGDQFYKAGAGDMFFLSANIPHALKNIGKEQCEYFAFQWRN